MRNTSSINHTSKLSRMPDSIIQTIFFYLADNSTPEENAKIIACFNRVNLHWHHGTKIKKTTIFLNYALFKFISNMPKDFRPRLPGKLHLHPDATLEFLQLYQTSIEDYDDGRFSPKTSEQLAMIKILTTSTDHEKAVTYLNDIHRIASFIRLFFTGAGVYSVLGLFIFLPSVLITVNNPWLQRNIFLYMSIALTASYMLTTLIAIVSISHYQEQQQCRITQYEDLFDSSMHMVLSFMLVMWAFIPPALGAWMLFRSKVEKICSPLQYLFIYDGFFSEELGIYKKQATQIDRIQKYLNKLTEDYHTASNTDTEQPPQAIDFHPSPIHRAQTPGMDASPTREHESPTSSTPACNLNEFKSPSSALVS
ncbi:MAG: hypothetical protein NTW08_06415 [Gammaproteobacteria bacterium]|nr:hypothetical protein [Gammaproteobacteria bacterium]